MVLQAFQNIGRGILGTTLSADSPDQDFVPIPQTYALLQAYYDNAMYGRTGTFRDLRSGLPVTIRPVHNPVARVVDWYAGRVYPGAWSDDGLPTGGKPNRIPYDDATPDEVRLAVQQAFTWSGAGFDIGYYVRTGATLGDVFAEIVCDIERQKVYPKVLHPSWVTDAEWNDSGDLTMYRLEIPMQDGATSFMWGKLTTKETITTLYNGKPHGYDGEPATKPNPWGFVPGVFVQHRNVGGQHGAPAFASVLSKIDELNGIVSEINDYIMKFTKQHVIIGTDDVTNFNTALNNANTATRAGTIADTVTADQVTGRRDRLNVAAAKHPVSAIRLLENMGLSDAVPHRDALLHEIEQDLPEITLAEKLLNMSQVTGPGAVPLVQDVQHKLDEAAANYDAGIIKLGQMSISIAAQCIRDGIWNRRALTSQQQRFSPFSVDSYDRGDLLFSISPRTLIPETMEQRIAQAVGLERVQTTYGMEHIGFNDDEAAVRITANREAKQFETDLSGQAFSAGFPGI